jgi:hypothetical protein
MAATEVQGVDLEFLLRDAGSADDFKEMVCEETLTFDLNNEVQTTKTKCGTFKGVQVADFKANGSGVCNVTPTLSEYSYDALQDDQIAITKKEFIIRNKSFGVIGAGEAIRMGGDGYFVTSQLSGNVGEVCKFTWSFEGVGTLNTTES